MKKNRFLGILAVAVLGLVLFAACPPDGGDDNKPDGEYTVTFNINGGTGTTPSKQTVNAGSSITLPNGNGLSKNGFVFNGWNTNNTGTGTNYNAGSSYTPTDTIVLYAKWDAVVPEDKSFSVQLTETKWKEILTGIDTEGKFVNLDLSACTSSTENTGGGLRSDGMFDPLYSFSTGKDKIVSLILPTTATSIADTDYNVVNYFTQLTSVEAQGIISIGSYAFYQCVNLTSVNIPKATSIGNSAFGFCYGLTSVNFPDATSIGNNTFVYCAFTSVNFPNVTSIGEDAFSGCVHLTSVSFPNVTNIGGSGAFTGCTNLTIINFPKITSIGYSVFYRCSGLTNVSFPNVTNIDIGAFTDCTSLTTVNFPNVTDIGDGAFIGCTNLTSVTLGLSAPKLGVGLFQRVSALDFGLAQSVTVKVPSGATGYGTIPATYSGTDTTQNWGNGFRGGGWDGIGKRNDQYINSDITLNVVYLE